MSQATSSKIDLTKSEPTKSTVSTKSVHQPPDSAPSSHTRDRSEDAPARSSASQYRKKKTKRKRSKHRHRHHQKEVTQFDYDKYEGVVHVILNEEVQHILKCVVGEDVTAEKPWTHIKKYFISEQVESDEVPPEYETFLPYKQAIADFPNDIMLIGYIPDESRDYDEYYFCLTVEVEEAVTKLIKEQEELQLARLQNTINKKVREWQTLGSEAEIEEAWITNTRGLLIVEFEAKYPIITDDVKFRMRLVHEARDGYAELKTGPRYQAPILHKKRIDNSMQVAPIVRVNHAQTTCSYPKNVWTQYEYHVDFIEDLSRDWMANFRYFTNSRMEELSDTLNVNGNLNLYSNDYMDLVDVDFPIVSDIVFKEYQSFDDVKRCMNKMISAMSWHPMWSGVVAIAYANVSPRWYHFETKEENLMQNIVHGYNPILVWSFNDSLYPKLILETNAEVHCLSFCPHDPNLLVGGCVNGQIILWDIKNKLTKVETEEILTPAQQSYRTRLFAEMSWMKNTRDYSLVPPTAFSQLLFSHINNVTSISWIHPMYKIENTGHVEMVSEDEAPSLQFVSSSSDGTIKFWDLKQKVIISGDYKPVRKSRRLGKRPSALTMDVSSYRFLNRKMLPHFEVNIILPGSEKLCPVASICFSADQLKYVEKNPEIKKTYNLTDRISYEPVKEYSGTPVIPVITVGTYTGMVMAATWEGYEYISGDVCSREDAKFIATAKYHDGPVLACRKHPVLNGVYLTIGGKVFCIWMDKLKGKPLLWRRSRHKYTHGNWEQASASCFWITTSNGSCEYWNLEAKSDGPYLEHMYSGKPLLESEVHPLPIMNDTMRMVGIADDRGTLRLILYNAHKGDNIEEQEAFLKFLNNNADRALDFEEWQTKWTDTHASWIKEQAEFELAEQIRLREEELARQAFEEEQRAKEAVEEAKREAAKLHPPVGKYEEWAIDRWILKEQERMGIELLTNKRLDKDTLMRQQAPLKRIEVEAAKKQQKIKQRLAKVEEIFNETIAMLFPNMVEKQIPDVYEKISYTDDQKVVFEENLLNAFNDIEAESNEVIEMNPFVYELDWKKILNVTKNKKIKDAFHHTERHSDRHKQYKIRRESSDVSFWYYKKHQKKNEEEEEEAENEEDQNDLTDTYDNLF
ncbi:dynein axonemal intermediate chain 3-like [Atheta coriaria]|uniref:dynein axonemal intermediate chain 3-like n=1 Tax=Dalotia coriaria TaxID=877792 RepID=UPI0031F35AEE